MERSTPSSATAKTKNFPQQPSEVNSTRSCVFLVALDHHNAEAGYSEGTSHLPNKRVIWLIKIEVACEGRPAGLQILLYSFASTTYVLAKTTSLHDFCTPASRCFPLPALRLLRRRPPVHNQKSPANAPNLDRENRPAVLYWSSQRQTRQVRGLCHHLPPAVHDARQLLARHSEVHVHWCVENLQQETDCHDFGP